jgi:hypothetical protein
MKLIQAILVATFAVASTSQANNVSAQQEGSLLRITGDGRSNWITVSQSSAGDVTIAGANGTRVNGRPLVRFVRPEFSQAEILLGAGNDRITFIGFTVTNDLFVNLEAGNDILATVAASPVRVGKNFRIQGEAGNDVIRLSNVISGEDIGIEGGTGVLAASVVNSEVGKSLTVIGDLLPDSVTVSGTTAAGLVSVETKSGNDRVNLARSTANGWFVDTAEGSDRIAATLVASVEDIGLFAGTEADLVTLVRVTAGKNLTLTLDTGNDRAFGQAVTAALDLVIEGGDGRDILTNRGISGGTKSEIKEIEVLLR